MGRSIARLLVVGGVLDILCGLFNATVIADLFICAHGGDIPMAIFLSVFMILPFGIFAAFAAVMYIVRARYAFRLAKRVKSSAADGKAHFKQMVWGIVLCCISVVCSVGWAVCIGFCGVYRFGYILLAVVGVLLAACAVASLIVKVSVYRLTRRQTLESLGEGEKV